MTKAQTTAFGQVFGVTVKRLYAAQMVLLFSRDSQLSRDVEALLDRRLDAAAAESVRHRLDAVAGRLLTRPQGGR